ATMPANVRTLGAWSRARVSGLAPVGLIVAVAIICVVVGVVTSARLADKVAVHHDEELFLNAIAQLRERVLREVESVATTDQARTAIRGAADVDWIDRNVALTLKNHFGHDDVFVVGPNDRMIYPARGSVAGKPAWIDQVRPDLDPILAD